MKKKKIIIIMILSVIILGIVETVSYSIESRSQKLPAVIQSDKIYISSEVDGILKQYFVTSMQQVKAHDLIAEVDNNKLRIKLDNLKSEKNKYQELISSAHTGDYLKSELYRLDESIQENMIDLEKAKQDLIKINQKLLLSEDLYINTKKQFEANKKLYDKGILSNPDFEKAAKDFRTQSSDYYALKSDSLIASETIKSIQKIISLLQARKQIMSNDENILGSKYVLDLKEVDMVINEIQADMNNFMVYSPINGVVTDINYRPGEKIDKGDVIAQIADFRHIWVIAYGNSVSRHKVKVGQKVHILCNDNKKLWGRVATISPVMEKVSSLGNSSETVNTYSKLEINFDNMQEALKYITPGERLFVRIYY